MERGSQFPANFVSYQDGGVLSNFNKPQYDDLSQKDPKSHLIGDPPVSNHTDVFKG